MLESSSTPPVPLGWHGWPPAGQGRQYLAQRRRIPSERGYQMSAQWYGHRSAGRKPAGGLGIVRLESKMLPSYATWYVQWWILIVLLLRFGYGSQKFGPRKNFPLQTWYMKACFCWLFTLDNVELLAYFIFTPVDEVGFLELQFCSHLPNT